jgi:hypothetical protein
MWEPEEMISTVANRQRALSLFILNNGGIPMKIAKRF